MDILISALWVMAIVLGVIALDSYIGLSKAFAA